MEQAGEILAEAGLRAARGLRQTAEQLVDVALRKVGIAAGRADEIESKAVAISEHRLDEVFGQDLRMAAGKRARLGALNSGAGALGIAFEVHEIRDPCKKQSAERQGPKTGVPVDSLPLLEAAVLILRKR